MAVDSNAEITEECLSFYKELYHKEEVYNNLNSNQQCIVKAQSRLRSVKGWLNKCPILKCPVLSLHKEFYVFAFKYIGKSFVWLLNHCYSEETLLPGTYNLHLL